MSSYTDLIEVPKIKQALVRKQVALADLDTVVAKINELDKENPKERIFAKIEKQADKAAENVKHATKDLNKLLLESNSDIINDKDFLAQQKHERQREVCLFNAVEDYIAILNNKGIKYPDETKSVPDSTNVLELIKTMEEKSDKESGA